MTLQSFTTLEWSADALPPPDQIDAIAAQVFADLDAEIDKPAQCVFSVISLTDDDDGPSVHVTGDKTQPVFHCRYSATTTWS
jgi:hypothetical protein